MSGDGPFRELSRHIDDGGRLAVVKAPPGSGKTHLLMRCVAFARSRKLRVAVATQTRSQADDICLRMSAEHPKVDAIRFSGSGTGTGSYVGKAVVAEKFKDLPTGPCVVVGTSAKWSLTDVPIPFDLLFVEEAWQLSWADFMGMAAVSGRFVLIGDPGQIDPVVSIDVSRWQTSPRPPHDPAPEVILRDRRLTPLLLSLPVTRRLPADTKDVVQSFYDFEFGALARPGERLVQANGKGKSAIDRALSSLAAGTITAVTLPTPEGGPPADCDVEAAETAVKVAKRLLELEARAVIDGKRQKLRPEDIGLCATHRVVNGAMSRALPRKYAGTRVDTPERWQGLQRKVMVIVHPLSGVTTPSAFDLATGRLCVMASRHLAGLVVVTRDHVGSTLDGYLPVADQAVGRPDAAGQGHARNRAVWSWLEEHERVFPVR